MEAERKYPHTLSKGWKQEGGCSKANLKILLLEPGRQFSWYGAWCARTRACIPGTSTHVRRWGRVWGLWQLWCWWGGDRIHESHCQAACPNQRSPATSRRPCVKEEAKELLRKTPAATTGYNPHTYMQTYRRCTRNNTHVLATHF